MFHKVLIANRGEIACRVIRTARRMGVGTVAVYSEADRDALHVQMADEAWLIGPAPASGSYLSIDRLLEAAQRSGAQAIHPGYGFLSESADFAARCRLDGFVFIGPSPEAMRAIGGKAGAKKLVARIGAPTVPGFHGEAQDVQTFLQAAKQIGFPIVVKASAGGGGRGMRVVWNAEELPMAMESAGREALAAFGDGRLLIEKYLERPRHVEVQLVADSFGNVVTFPERDCSLQRHHQKLVEETPAPNLAPALRQALRATASEIARAAGYTGAGTVEFLVKDDDFYFLEVNARLQVEHPVTEMISGVDLVEWQFRVAAGDRLPMREEEIGARGCAIEARICAEDPAENFRPSSGSISHLVFPPESAAVRIETGVRTGDRVSPYYDSLLAKLIVWDDEREGAVRKMQWALSKVELVGVASNLDFLRRLVDQRRFVVADADTRLVDAVSKTSPPPDEGTKQWLLAAAAAAWRQKAAESARSTAAASGERWSPWAEPDAWRLAGRHASELDFRLGAAILTCRFGLIDAKRFWIETPRGRSIVSATFDGYRMGLCLDGVRRECSLIYGPDGYVVVHQGRNFALEWIDPLAPPARGADREKGFVAPLPARVTRIFVKDGERVMKGAPILLLEAMKMEIPMNAPKSGVIEAVLCNEGQSVQEGETLVAMAEGA
ncbi:MAG: ATP-grasp domain-containing protein [Hyphomicrobiales bacterium]|nr:MAG: ATP-grasp domain-containing protein [Hyphomicrobiales bacterium]